MIAAIAIAVAVTLGLWVAFEAYHSRLLDSFMTRWRFAALRSPALISTPVREIDGMLGVIRKLLAGTAGLVIGFAIYGLTSALGISAAHAAEVPPVAFDTRGVSLHLSLDPLHALRFVIGFVIIWFGLCALCDALVHRLFTWFRPQGRGARFILHSVAILVCMTLFAVGSARAEPIPCMPAALDVAWTKTPGVTARRITRDGVNLAAVVEAFLANKGVPDLNTDDFVVVSDSEKVIVKPVRAGLVCRNSIAIAIPLGTGGQELLKEIELAELGRGRA